MPLKHAMIFVKDLPRMTRFYREALGFTLIAQRSTAEWSEFDGGLALHAAPATIAATLMLTDPPRARAETPIKLVFAVDDVVVARAHLVAHGAAMQEPRSWDACDGVDLEGNVFQIVKA
jgi:catechol 2,3-dioxygenase-like lactoylglutathione lyase family enzyme